jgi:hypothetical protein
MVAVKRLKGAYGGEENAHKKVAGEPTRKTTFERHDYMGVYH